MNLRVGRKAALIARRHRRRVATRLAGDQPGTAGADQGHAGARWNRVRWSRVRSALVPSRHAAAMRSGRRWRAASRGCSSTRAMSVKAGQLLAELDPVDLEDRVASGQLAAERAASIVRAAEAQLAEAQSRAHTRHRERAPLRRTAHTRTSSARKRQTPKRTKRRPRRRRSMRHMRSWQLRGATTTGRCPMSRASASCARRRGSRAPSTAWSARDWSSPAPRSLLGRRCCRSSTRQACGSGRASTRARPAACGWDSPQRSCCARTPSALIAGRSSVSTG